jgi:pilus assembly protein Flp/PilA
MISTIGKFWKDESGATAVEYGLIAGLVSVAAIIALQTMGTSLISIFGVVSTNLEDAAASATASSG